MTNKILYFLTIVLFASCISTTQKTNKTTCIFNGKNLEHWSGDPLIWSVEDGCIVGETTNDIKIKQNTFLIFDETLDNFELTFEYKIMSGNSGVQYRAKIIDPSKYSVGGYQADMEAGINYSGILYEEKGRGILANRGEKVVINEAGEKTITQFTKSKIIQSHIKSKDWNSYKIIANGTHLQHFINNQLTVGIIDNELHKNASSGILALQVHTGPPMKVYYKNLRYKKL
jgi:hypothetical protein